LYGHAVPDFGDAANEERDGEERGHVWRPGDFGSRRLFLALDQPAENSKLGPRR